MKKMVLLAAVMMIAAPAMATITFAVTDNEDGTFTVSYTSDAGDLPRGVAIKVDVTGNDITGIVADSQLAAFNANIDHLYSNPGDDLDTPGQNALALDGAPGVFVSGHIAVISAGVLDTAGGQGAGPSSSDPDGLITITTDMVAGETALVTLTADVFRGPGSGVVGSVIDSNLSGGGFVEQVITAPPEECLKETDPGYAFWLAGGEPDCWCYRRHCRGDADGVMSGPFHVAMPDLQLLIPYFNVFGITDALCADFDHITAGPFRVGMPDLQLLIPWFNVMDIPAGNVPECSMTDVNFWTN